MGCSPFRFSFVSLVLLLAVALAAHPAAAASPKGPAVSVVVRSPDVPPDQMDSSIAAPLAEAIAALPQVENVESESTEGACTTVVSFAPQTEPDAAVRRVADALTAARRRLPAGIDPPQVRAGDARALPTLWVAVQSDTLDLIALSALARTIVSPVLATVPGVAEVRIVGGAEPRPTLWLDAGKLPLSGLTPGDVAQVIAEQAGAQTKAGPRIRIPDELSKVVLRVAADGTVVRIGDVGRCEMASADRGFATFDGHPAVLLAVTSRRGERAKPADIERALAGSARELPAGAKATLALTLSPESLLAKLNLAAGASAESLRKATDQAEAALRRDLKPAPSAVVAFSDPAGDGARVLVQLAAKVSASTASANARNILSTAAPADTQIRVCPVTFDFSGLPVTFPIRVALVGPEAAAVRLWAASTLPRLRDTLADPGMEPPGPGEPRLRFEIDRKRCADLGLKETDVTEMIALVRGCPRRVPFADGTTLEMRLEGEKADGRPPPFQLPKMRNATGDWVPLGVVTTVEQAIEPTEVLRLNGHRCVLLTAAPSADTSIDTAANQCLEAANAELRDMKHLEGYRAIRLDH